MPARVLVPLVFTYALFIAMLWLWAVRTRRPERLGTPARLTGSQVRFWPHLVRHVLGTAAVGYVGFLAIVLAFYFFLGGESGLFVRQAFAGGAFLAFVVATPVLVLLGSLELRKS